MPNTFGKLFKKLRMKTEENLTSFCKEHGFAIPTVSRIENGKLAAPQKEELLKKYAIALGLKKGTPEWVRFFDTAAASVGLVPQDLLQNQMITKRLPSLYKALRKNPKKLDEWVPLTKKQEKPQWRGKST